MFSTWCLASRRPLGANPSPADETGVGNAANATIFDYNPLPGGHKGLCVDMRWESHNGLGSCATCTGGAGWGERKGLHLRDRFCR